MSFFIEHRNKINARLGGKRLAFGHCFLLGALSGLCGNRVDTQVKHLGVKEIAQKASMSVSNVYYARERLNACALISFEKGSGRRHAAYKLKKTIHIEEYAGNPNVMPDGADADGMGDFFSAVLETWRECGGTELNGSCRKALQNGYASMLERHGKPAALDEYERARIKDIVRRINGRKIGNLAAYLRKILMGEPPEFDEIQSLDAKKTQGEDIGRRKKPPKEPPHRSYDMQAFIESTFHVPEYKSTRDPEETKK